MTNILAEICQKKRAHVSAQKAAIGEATLRQKIRDAEKPRGFKAVLEGKIKNRQIGLIAEIKKASPSKGIIREDFDPAQLAKAYAQGGAACLSVLTDAPYFQGDDNDLATARAAVSLPVLRKDFMLDTYQILESRALGADCILLIMAALEDAQAQELAACACELGMDMLLEVHDRRELARTLDIASNNSRSMIGINNRDLKTLAVDLAVSETLAKDLPAHMLCVCESGIDSHQDIARMQKAGIACFLVGESLMRRQDVTAATRNLLGLAP
jgi:indole-3-glycerol phosphate synthase